MKYIDEYRDKALISNLVAHIKKEATGNYHFMEVCGGHTAAILRFGIPSLLPGNIKLISGPGCPVCVTNVDFIDKAITYSEMDDFIIATFGDLIRVPGSSSSLERQKEHGADVRIVFSGLEALEIARVNRSRKIIFPGIGFETTAPGIAVTIKEASDSGMDNFYVLSALKIMPPAIEEVISDGVSLNGFICPGHVAAITGSSIFNFISEKYKLGCVVTGFEPVDLLQSILMLIRQVNNGSPKTEIQYTRVVTDAGNRIAKDLINEVFILSDIRWRGFGNIKSSGLNIREKYERYNAERIFPVNIKSGKENSNCICSQILRGKKLPPDCSLFSEICDPQNPVGACMVSEEGACNVYFKYNSNE
jgi:hydrogenase expression/formation protein HypD